MCKSEFTSRVESFIAANSLMENSKRPVMVAVSGGADSVALLRVLLDLGSHCIVMHCNFHLRGEESMRDQRFVEALCGKLQVPFDVKHFDVPLYQSTHRASVEVACRELRYVWFNEEMLNHRAQAIAVAHHIDDNIETLLLNLLRGTGIAGLTGMHPRNDKVVRPLLCVSRNDVTDYLSELGQDYVTDSTNLECDHTRNKIRNRILPAIERDFPMARKAIATTISNLTDVEGCYDTQINEVLREARTKNGFKLSAFLDFPYPKLLVYAALKPYGFSRSQCEAIAESLRTKHKGRPAFYSSTHCVTLSSTVAFVEPLVHNTMVDQAFDPFDTLKLPIDITVSFVNEPFSSSCCDGKCVVAFSHDILKCESLRLRNYRRGDAMRPFGMRGTRKVSDILTTAKYTRHMRQNVYVLEADGTIIWVVGVRSGNAFRVTPGDTHYLQLTYKPEERSAEWW